MTKTRGRRAYRSQSRNQRKMKRSTIRRRQTRIGGTSPVIPFNNQYNAPYNSSAKARGFPPTQPASPRSPNILVKGFYGLDNCIGKTCEKIGAVVDHFSGPGQGVPYGHKAPSAQSTMHMQQKPRAASPHRKTK